MNSQTSGHEWYALQVRPRYERLVAYVLENKGFDPFLPLHRCSRKWSDSYVEVEEPVFPGYLFCKLDLSQRLMPLLTTPGFIRILGIGRRPSPVAEEEIERVRRIVNSGMIAYPAPVPRVGDLVRLESGPLKGLEGTLISVRKRHRLVVSVSLLQRAVAVEVDEEFLHPDSTVCSPGAVPLRHPTVSTA